MRRFLVCLSLVITTQCLNNLVAIIDSARVEKTQQEAQTAKSDLEDQYKRIEDEIAEQSKKVEDAQTNDERERERQKLSDLNTTAKQVLDNITSLSQFINKVNQEGPRVTEGDVTTAQGDITQAQKLTQELKQEFVSQNSDNPEETSQQKVEQLPTWQTFQLIVRSFFKEAQATVAKFFGSKAAVIAARNDLSAIYETLQDYGAKAQNAGNLASVYAELGQIANAVIAHSDALDAAQLEYQKSGKVSDATMATIQTIASDILELQDSLQQGESLGVSQELVVKIRTQIDNFLGQLGLKIRYDKSSSQPLTIVPMTLQEKTFFDEQQQSEQSGILTGGGIG